MPVEQGTKTDMAKRKKKTRNRKRRGGPPSGFPSLEWMDQAGMHVVAPGTTPTPEQLREMTEEYRKQVRNSPIWDMMVGQFGEKRAEEMLKEFQVTL